jgi:uroporphyrinogen decarboxylase
MERMTSPVLEHPAPDFAELERVLKGEQEPRRVQLVELLIDEEVLKAIIERYLDTAWVPHTKETRERYLQQLINVYYRLGYDFVPIAQWPPNWLNHPPLRKRLGEDSADLSRGVREWVEESGGLISTWDEFEQFAWDRVKPDLSHYELATRYIPEGMKIVVSTNFFEHVFHGLLGIESLAYMIYDEPELVAQICEQWGQKVYDFYEAVVDMEKVGAIFHPDDLGFKTSTLISPDALRQYVLPWHKKYAALAHEHGKMFWFHSCGNLYKSQVIKDILEDVGIDAFHSFQDVILPVVEFKACYGDRVATLGGVDVDKMARMAETDLRKYIQDILERCMRGGRYALGTGNSVANYIPLRNYFILPEESRRWQPPV